MTVHYVKISSPPINIITSSMTQSSSQIKTAVDLFVEDGIEDGVEDGVEVRPRIGKLIVEVGIV